MKEQPKWVRIPTGWIINGRLRELKWGGDGRGADSIAALMVLLCIAHSADEELGIARLTYDEFSRLTGLSRSKLSNGLDILTTIDVVGRTPEGRSTYKLMMFNPKKGWAKLPVKSMYASERISAFDDFKLRRRVELDALKLFFLFIAMRDRKTNMAIIGYGKILEYSGIERQRIKPAISFLASLSLVYVEQIPSQTNEHGISNAYRVVGIDTTNHMGTKGRARDAIDYGSEL